MSATGRVRRATTDDLVGLTELHRQFCAVDGHPFDADRAANAFAPLLGDDRHGVVWLFHDGTGYAVLTWAWSIEAGGAEAVLDEIFVTDRDRGHGAVLIEHVIADARQRGLARIFLETESHNVRVRSFYQQHGFVADDSIWMSRTFTDLS